MLPAASTLLVGRAKTEWATDAGICGGGHLGTSRTYHLAVSRRGGPFSSPAPDGDSHHPTPGGATTRGRDFRALLRSFPSAVAVLSVEVESERLGLTVGSIVSLSLEPPLVGVAISRQAAMHELLRRAGGFALSLLAGDQDDLAQHFARGVPPIALWEGIATRPGTAGAPLLEGALGWLECRISAEHSAGDHTFFVGEVVAAVQGRSSPALVYVEQSYRSL